MTYAILTAAKTTDGSIKNWVSHDSIPSGEILADAQDWLAARVRNRRMLKLGTALTIVADDESAALASDFLDPLSFNVRSGGAMEFIPEEDLLRLRARHATDGLGAGEPHYFTWFGETPTAYFDLKADGSYTIDYIYYAKPAVLVSSTNETNLWTNQYRLPLRHACTAYAYEWLKDYDRAKAELSVATLEVEKRAQTDDLGRRGQVFDIEAV